MGLTPDKLESVNLSSGIDLTSPGQITRLTEVGIFVTGGFEKSC